MKLKLARLLVLCLAVLGFGALQAQDKNAVTYQGHAYKVEWVEDMQFGTHTYDQTVAWLWTYSPFPQLAHFGCLQNAKWSCISPGFLNCSSGEAPLEIVQLNPPSAYPVRVIRKCNDPAPGVANCVRVSGYANMGSSRAETTNPANINVLGYGECTAK